MFDFFSNHTTINGILWILNTFNVENPCELGTLFERGANLHC